MRVKILDAMSSGKLENKVKRFLERERVDVINIQISTGFGNVVAMIQYED